MRSSFAQQLLLLIVLAAPFFGGRFRLATAAAQQRCSITSWPSYLPIDVASDTKPKQLAIASLKDYLKGLEQTTAGDLQCPHDWNGEGLEVRSACLNPNRSEYAISFTYNVKCAMTSSSEGSAQQEVEVAEIAGSLEGLLPAALPAAIMTEVGDNDSSTTMRSLIMAT